MKTGILAGLMLGMSTLSALAFPDKEIQLIIPWPAGGGTDAIGRMLAAGLEKELGQSVIVINRTGGAGVIAHTEIANAEPDGHTIGLVTVDLVTYKWLAMSDITYENVVPVALLNTDSASFTVGKNSPWPDLKSALAAIKNDPAGTYSLASVAGTGNHLSVASMLLADGTDPNKLTLLPQPVTAGLLELGAGGVDITPFSLPETRSMIDAGEARPLGVFSAERVPGFDSVPTVKEATGYDVVGGTWRGIAGPKGLPDDIRDQLETAIKKVWDSQEFQDFMKKQSFGLTWLDHAAFGDFMKTQTDQFGVALEAVGLRK